MTSPETRRPRVGVGYRALLALGLRRRLRALLDALDLPAAPADRHPVTELDLAHLPAPAQRYLRFMGVVGRPRHWSLRARFSGRFRMRRDQPWMPCEAWQYNHRIAVSRVFVMRVAVAGAFPMSGVDSYVDGRGHMRGKLFGLVTVAEGTGPEFDVGELVTYLNDACLLAPSMLLVPDVSWRGVDDDSFDLVLSDRGLTVAARVVVDDRGRLTGFTTTDRFADLPGGPVRAPWSTPVSGWTSVGGRPLPAEAGAVWRLDDGEFRYVQGRFVPDSVEYDVPPRR